MIEFLTLFLGLVSGPQEVRVTVAPKVVAVEVLLDGAMQARLTGQPWQTRIDFGPDLAPRRLEAVGYDDAGVEIGRALQLLNSPRPAAEAGVVLERDEAGRATSARLSWESLGGSMPLRVLATFDGQALPTDDPGRIPLPSHDPDRFHLFHARLEFAGAITAIAQAGFGGAEMELIGSELTAFPVALRKKGGEPSLSDLGSWIRAGGSGVSVAALERGPGKVVVVRGQGVQQTIERMEGTLRRGAGSGVSLQGPRGVGGVRDLTAGATATGAERQREAFTLGQGVGIHLLLPKARQAPRRYLQMELFAASPEISPRQGGLHWALTQTVVLAGLAPEQRIGDAVAIAGLQAASGSRRRAVVLVVADDLEDRSLYRPASVRRLLDALDVPLYVWTTGTAASPTGWPEATSIEDLQDLRRAASALERDLERQRIVWIHGLHDPSRLELARSAPVQRLTE